MKLKPLPSSRTNNSFVHLHVHSNYSLLDGTMSVRSLVEHVCKLGMTTVALTDHNALYGAIEFYQICKEAGVKPIIGAQISLTDDSALVLLVRNETGYRNLCEIISTGHLRGGHLNFKCELNDILTYKEGLIVLSGGKRGAITRFVMNRNFDDAQSHCRWMQERFGGFFYVELQRFLGWDDFINEQLQGIADKCNVPLVATNDVHLLSPEALPLRKVLHAIDQNTMRERVRTAGHKQQYLKAAWEMRRQFARYPQAVENSLQIAAACNLELKLGKPVFPIMDLPKTETAHSYLQKLCSRGANACYNPVTKQVQKRIKYELGIIDKLGFSDYFLIVKDIVDFCRRESIPCVGRGSAADSIVAYVLGITFADPIRFNLYFERFLNPERTDAPDIDLDICWRSRDRVLQYVYEKYGIEKTAMICTFSTFQTRSAIRDVAKVFGLPEEEISQLLRDVPHMAKMTPFDKALKAVPQIGNGEKIDRTVSEILQISNQLAGFPRHLSIHAGGVIIAPDKLTYYTPLEVAGKGIVISQYDMHSIERLGLVKMDLLGVRSLTIITECLEKSRKLKAETRNRKQETYQPEFRSFLDLRAIPDNDPATIRMIKAGKTLGCFQLESPLVRGVLRKMQTDSVEDTVVAVAVIRPGVGDSGMKDEYILRRGGVRPVRYSHPILEPVLKETHGLTLYQEQVLLIAQAVAGFTLAQGDTLRRAMTKDRNPELMHSMHKQFIKGAFSRGISEKKAVEIWQFLQQFIGFGFNKAHAATYGILAYQTAFLKCYFPVEFMTAVLNNVGGFYATAVYIEECRRLELADGTQGIPLLPPDVNKSDCCFTIENNDIRVGLNSIFELSDRSKKAIVAAQTTQPFKDIYDFFERTRAGEKETEHLIRCGAMRSLHPSEPLLLMKCQSYFKNARSKSMAEYMIAGIEPQPYSNEMRILAELELLSFGVTAHPLALYDGLIPWENMVSSLAIEANKNKRVQFTGWYVTSRLQKTVTGKYMKFLSLEDKFGICEVIFFPEVYGKYADILRGYGPFTVIGKVQSRIKGEANLIAEKVLRWPAPHEVVTQKMKNQQVDVFVGG